MSPHQAQAPRLPIRTSWGSRLAVFGLLVAAAAVLAVGSEAGALAGRQAHDDALDRAWRELDLAVAEASGNLAQILETTRRTGSFGRVPFPFEVVEVAWTRIDEPALPPGFGDAARLEFVDGDTVGATLAYRRLAGDAEDPELRARALRAAAHLEAAAGAVGEARSLLLLALDEASHEGAEGLRVAHALARLGDDGAAQETILAIESGGHWEAGPRLRSAIHAQLGGDPAGRRALGALVAVEEADARDVMVPIGGDEAAWWVSNRAGVTVVGLAARIDVARALLAGDIALDTEGGGRALPAPFAATSYGLGYGATSAAAEAGSDARLQLFLTALGLGGLLAAGALLLWLNARSRSRLDQRKDAFVCAVTHELKTPIANILLYAQTISEHGPDDPARMPSFAGVIADEALRLESRVQQILDVASGRSTAPADVRPFDVAAELRELTGEFRERAAAAGGDVVLTGADGRADGKGTPELLRRAVAALLDNAVKFAPGKTVRVDLSRHDWTLIITVTDEGPGIPVSERSRVLEPFVRLGDERTRDVPGTGLGLTLAAQCIEQCGGKLRFGEHPGTGVCLVIELPEAQL